jgi:hypothetical protein
MFIRFILFVFLSSLSLTALAQQDSTSIAGPTEARIIEGLTHADGKIRAACARRLRDLAAMGQLTIAPGHVVEHDLAYWEDKVPRMPIRIKKADFFETFELTGETFVENGSRRQFFQLDNSFLLETTVGRKRVVVERIYYRPRVIWVDAPSDYSGIWRQYYVNGEMFSEALHDDGVTVGIKRIYGYDGMLSWEEEYDEQGNILLRRHYNLKGELYHVQTEDLDTVSEFIED